MEKSSEPVGVFAENTRRDPSGAHDGRSGSTAGRSANRTVRSEPPGVIVKIESYREPGLFERNAIVLPSGHQAGLESCPFVSSASPEPSEFTIPRPAPASTINS